MNIGESVAGRQRAWSLTKKLGEGDAGEVYLVESVLDKRPGILKRPHRTSFSSDTIRQATQIETEGRLLQALGPLSRASGTIRLATPALLDSSKPGTEFSERFFIIIERAAGIDLNTLGRVAHFGLSDPALHLSQLENGERSFLEALARQGQVPALLLLRGLTSLIDLLETIHSLPSHLEGEDHQGILWNDVKPDHVFWDAARLQMTVIDWGNGRFLEADGATRDRTHSRWNDYAQFIQEMGRFAAEANPELYARTEWPTNLLPGFASTDTIQQLRERLEALQAEEMEVLQATRQEEADALHTPSPAFEQLEALDALQQRLIAFGEQPNYSGLDKFQLRLASRLAAEGRMQELGEVCNRAAATGDERWKLLNSILQAAQHSDTPDDQAWSHALSAGLNEDWPTALWELFALAGEYEEAPTWWDDLATQMRMNQLRLDPGAISPYVTLHRLSYTLEAALRKGAPTTIPANSETGSNGFTDPGQFWEKLVRTLRTEILPRWQELEPDPPDSGLEYSDVERLAADLTLWLPEAQQTIERALDQPRAQVKLVLEAWNRKEFETARRGLQRVLLWDPDRRRLLLAEHAILAAPRWLEKLYRGPKAGEIITEFATRMELSGRELRSQVGPARWLDSILEALMQLRKGAYAGDLSVGRPDLVNEMPWLLGFEPRHVVDPGGKPVRLARQPGPPPPEPTVRGVTNARLGTGQDLVLDESLDVWAPEAVGSSARVYSGLLRTGNVASNDKNNGMRPAAIKFMRWDQAGYALPLFREEVEILNRLRNTAGMTHLLECGLVRLDAGQQFPADNLEGEARNAAVRLLTGQVERFAPTESSFLNGLEARVTDGWVPYLALEKQRWEDNLLVKCDSGYTRGRLPTLQEGLRMAIQILDILGAAHSQNIVYRDHKILHYYWLEDYNGVFVLDWNVARLHPQGLSKAEKQFDLVQYGARALHQILTGRVAPGALPLGPTRPEEIEAASRTYPVRWTYDDQRLPNRLKEIIEIVLNGGYNEVKPLRDDLYAVFVEVNGEDEPS